MKGYYATSTKYLERYNKCPERLLPERFLDLFIECKDKAMACAHLSEEQKELEERIESLGEKALSRKEWFGRMKESGVHSLLELGFFALKYADPLLRKRVQTYLSDRFIVLYQSVSEAKTQAEKEHTPYAAVVIEVNLEDKDNVGKTVSPQILAGIGRVYVQKDIALDNMCRMYTNDENLTEIFNKWKWSVPVEKLSKVTTPFSIST